MGEGPGDSAKAARPLNGKIPAGFANTASQYLFVGGNQSPHAATFPCG
jgi:hypothetical protein